jgi:hypothetical protein
VYAEYNFYGGIYSGDQLLSSVFAIDADHADSDLVYTDLDYSTYLFCLEFISIEEMRLTEHYFKRLSAQSNLRQVILCNCDFDSKWLTHLSKCRKLAVVELKFNGSPLQWNVIKSLEKNNNIEMITLENVGITDEDVAVLNRLTDLYFLDLRSCVFQTDKTAESFYEFIEKRAGNLRRVDLTNIPDIELHIQAIIDKPKLHTISITSNNITDELIGKIKMPIGHRKQIKITSNSISDEGLMQIQLEPKIILDLVDTTITEEGIKNFSKANPFVTSEFLNEGNGSFVKLYRNR